MIAFFRRLDTLRKNVPRQGKVAAIGAVVLGLILGSVLAFGLVSSAVGLPFALGAALLTSPTSATHPQLGNRNVAEQPVSSSGCSQDLTPPDGQTVESSLLVNGVARDYWLHIPRGFAPSVPAPLLLAFHGHGATAVSFEHFSRLSLLADQRGFIVAYPQGAVGADGRPGWNTYRHVDPSTDDIGFVDALITHLQATVCVDPSRIYATGFSNGGGFVDVLACDLSTRIAAFAPVSGDYYPHPGGCHPSRPVSVLEIHGTADTTNPYYGSTQLEYPSVGQWLTIWATRDGCAERPTLQGDGNGVVLETWNGCQDGTKLAHYRLIGIGHTWLVGPSASPTPSASGQTHVLTFDTDTAIWDFLAAQQILTKPQA